MSDKEIFGYVSMGSAGLSVGMLISSFIVYATSDLPIEAVKFVLTYDLLAAISCALISIAFAQHKD